MEKDFLDKTSAHKIHRFHYKYLSVYLTSDTPIDLLNEINPTHSTDVSFDVLEKTIDSYKIKKRTLVLESNRSRTIIYKKNLGIFTLLRGKKIEFNPFGAIDSLSLSNTLLNLVFGFVLYQRGANVLHTSAVEIDNEAVLFVGPSGSGKSSLSSLFSEFGGFITEDLGVLKKTKKNFFIQKTLPIIKLENSKNKQVGLLSDDQRQRNLYYSSNPVKNEFTNISKIYFLQWGDSLELLTPSIKDLIFNFQISLFSAFPYNSCKKSSLQALTLISELEKNSRIRICSRSKQHSLDDTFKLLLEDIRCN